MTPDETHKAVMQRKSDIIELLRSAEVPVDGTTSAAMLLLAVGIGDALLAEAEDELERARLEVLRLGERLVFAQAKRVEKRRLRERPLYMKEEAQEVRGDELAAVLGEP